MEIVPRCIYYLIPGNVEILIEYANNNSNFGLYGMYLGIRNRRNMIYFSQATCVVLYVYNFRNIIFLFILLLCIQFNSYFRYIQKYKQYF
jgi:hypothetical protein